MEYQSSGVGTALIDLQINASTARLGSIFHPKLWDMLILIMAHDEWHTIKAMDHDKTYRKHELIFGHDLIFAR